MEIYFVTERLEMNSRKSSHLQEDFADTIDFGVVGSKGTLEVFLPMSVPFVPVCKSP